MLYTITIVWDEENEQWMYICEKEDVAKLESGEGLREQGFIDLSEYYDEEGLELIEGCYIMGEA